MEQKWLTKQIEYEGFPLYLRKPNHQDIFSHRGNLTHVLHVTQKLKVVNSNGLPDPDYNKTLLNFDGQMCKMFDPNDNGLIFLIETFSGKRHYYYFIADATEYENRIAEIKSKNPDVDLEINSHEDKDWSFLKDYPLKLY